MRDWKMKRLELLVAKITDLIKEPRLRWYGHVARVGECRE